MDCGIYITIRVPPQTARLRRDGVVSVSTGRLSSSRIAAIGHFIIHSIFQRLPHASRRSPSYRRIAHSRRGLIGDNTAWGLFFQMDSFASTYSSTSLPSGSRR